MQVLAQTRIDAQFAFLTEADRLKSVLRATKLCDSSRFENTSEHSWHVALYALVMAEHAAKPVDITRVLKMMLIHDLVEIDAGDTPIHSAAARNPGAQAAEEKIAADRIFGLLPDDQRDDFRALWDEFEAAETDDAIFAKSIDRVQPVISNLETGGQSWTEYNVSRVQVEDRVGAKVSRGAPALWSALRTRLDDWFGTG
ncbi:MAG: HD domain-containing protein [Yoonia sp.]|uniref:HD domain-containing protein n=1 Tax=Yoonia sp. TaxID=2212373 RepID=UPI003265AC2B